MNLVSTMRRSLVACLLLFAGAAAQAADPTTFLPDDCHLILVTKVKEQLNSPAYKELQKLTKDFGVPNQDESQLKDTMGLDPSNVLTVTAGMSLGKLEELAQQFQNQQPNTLPPMIMVAQLAKPTSAADIKANIKGKEFAEVKAGSYTMHDGKDLAFAVVDKTTVVYGPPSQLKAVLERNKAPKLSESMTKAAMELANPKSTAMAISLKEILGRQEVQQALQGANPQAQQLAGELEGVVLQFGMAQDIDISLNVLTKTNKGADELRKMADGFLALAKFQQIPKDAAEIIDSIKLSTKGSSLQGTMAIKTATLSRLIKEAAKQGLPLQ